MNAHDSVTHISFRKENFRVSFLQPFVVVFSSALFVSELFFHISGPQNQQVAFVIIPLVVMMLCAAAIAILQFRFKFHLGPDGIRCYDFWCRPLQASWDHLDDVHLVTTAGLQYLKIHVQDSSQTIWVPLFVRRSQLLHRLMMTYMQHSHDMHKKLVDILR